MIGSGSAPLACAQQAQARGQASVELIAVLGILLLAVVAFVALSTDIIGDVGAQKDRNAAREAVNKLAAAADLVYSQGEGASMEVPVLIPQSSELAGGASFIGKPEGAPDDVKPTTILLRVRGTDEYATTGAPLSGSFPETPGAYRLKVTSLGSYVSIGSDIIEVSPSSLYAIGRPGEPSAAYINIRLPNSGSNPVWINATAQPAGQYVGLNITPAQMITYTSAQLAITFQPPDNAAGIYNWVLSVDARGCLDNSSICPRDHIRVPVTFEVG